MTQEENILKMMRCLDISREEAIQLIEDDKKVDRMKDSEVNADLTKEQQQAVKKARQAERAPTAYKFTPRERKPNATKGGLIAELHQFLTENSNFATENVEITNKERQIAFTVGDNSFELTLVQKRKPK